MKARNVLALLMAACIVLTMGCRAAAPTPTPTPRPALPTATPTEVPKKKAKVLLMTQVALGINPYFINGKEGLDWAARDFDIETHLIEGTGDVAKNADNLRAASREDWDVIILMTSGFVDTLLEVAPDTPEKAYVCIDCFIADPPANVRSVGFLTHENSFLEGVVAGLLTKSNIIGVVGPMDLPFIHRWTEGFADGAKYINPDVTVLETLWTGSFADPAKAKELALTLADQGADHINAAAAAGNPGIFEAAQERGFYTYGVDINECPKAPGHIAESNIKQVDVAVYDSVRDYLAGEAIGGSIEYSLADGGVDLAVFAFPDEDTQCVLEQYPDAIEKVREIRQKIIDGELVVRDPLLD